MKITIVLGAFFPVPPIMGGAIEKVFSSLSREFVRLGHEVTMVSRAMPQFPRAETIGGVRHVRVCGFDAPRSLVWMKFLDLLYSLNTIRVLPKADIIVTNTFWLPILLRNAKRGRIYVHVVRYPKGQMRLYSKAARLQAPSRFIAHAIAAEAPKLAHKVAVVPNPVPRATGDPLPIAQRQRIILYVGRIHPEKGLHLLIDSFAGAARTAFADWKLVIVGSAEATLGGGGESYLRNLVRRAESTREQIIFRGGVYDPTALEQELSAARLFVYPSLAERGEAFGVAPLEAMAHGCPVIVSSLECFRDFIRDNETGFVFDHRARENVEVLRDKIDNVISNETLLARVASTGYEKSKEYSPERVAKQFLEDFESLTREDV
jgi:glycosyltransferase involved in cell wall biosynthesis